MAKIDIIKECGAKELLIAAFAKTAMKKRKKLTKEQAVEVAKMLIDDNTLAFDELNNILDEIISDKL